MASRNPGGPRKHQLSKMSLLDFGDAEDARIAARLGRLSYHAELSAYLSLFYDAKREPSDFEKEIGIKSKRKEGTIKAVSDLLGAKMAAALHDGDAGFFDALSKLIPLHSKGSSAVSPIDHALLTLHQSRDETEQVAFQKRLTETISNARLLEWAREATRAQSELARYDFPEWPPTAPHLHKWLLSAGIECDEKAVRKVAKKHGISLAPAKLGAPKKK